MQVNNFPKYFDFYRTVTDVQTKLSPINIPKLYYEMKKLLPKWKEEASLVAESTHIIQANGNQILSVMFDKEKLMKSHEFYILFNRSSALKCRVISNDSNKSVTLALKCPELTWKVTYGIPIDLGYESEESEAQILTQGIDKVLQIECSVEYETWSRPYGKKMPKTRQIVEWCREGTLGTVRDLTTAKTIKIMLDVAKALKGLHAKDVLHRDLKPDNIFVKTSWEGCLGDIETCCALGSKKLEQFRSTADCVAPEIAVELVKNKQLCLVHDDKFSKGLTTGPTIVPGLAKFVTKESDVWSFGICLQFGLDRFPDYCFENDKRDFELWRLLGKISQLKDGWWGKEPTKGTAMHVAWRCLQFNPKDRMSADELVVQLEKLHLEGEAKEIAETPELAKAAEGEDSAQPQPKKQKISN